jgi:hypothetical protein
VGGRREREEKTKREEKRKNKTYIDPGMMNTHGI